MMGLGSLGNGGSSSSSSNLSPLAPPFTVDRSNSKATSNQLVNFSDSHYTVTVPFGQSWQYADPSASTHNFTDSVPSTCMPLSPEFSPSGSVNPSTTIWSTSNPTAKTSTEPYSFGCEGYYAPYVSPIGTTETPMGAFHEPSFDVPGNASSQVDYTQSLSGLEYPVPHWDPVWSRMSNGKQDEWKGVDGSFSLEKVDISASFGYRNCLSQGNSLDGVNIAREDSYALSGNYTDRMYTGPSSMGHMDDKSYLAQEPVYSSFNSKAGSIPPASCQAGLSLGSSKNYLNYENPFTPHDKFFQPLDSCLHDATTPTSKSSPAVVIRPAPSGSHFFGKKTGLNKTVDICKTGASNSEKSDACDLLKVDETRQPIGSPVKGFSLDTISLNFGKDVKDSIDFASSSLNNGCSSHPRVTNIAEISGEERSGAQAPYCTTFTEKCADALDLHNPNVDSPCWKGAPASRISLYDSVEAPSLYHLKSKLEYSDFGQSNPLFPQAEHSGGTSSKKLGEDNLHNHNVYADIGTRTADYITEEHRADGVTKGTFEHIGLSSYSGVIKFSQDLNKPSKGYDPTHYSENDSQLESSRGEHLCVDEHKFGPTKESLEEGFMHPGLNLNDALEGGVVALDAAENVLRSPASQEEAKQDQPYQTGSTPKLNVQTLVNAIHNLSELLKSQCLTNACLLEEQDHETLKHAITNLGACTSKKIETKEKLFSQHDSFEKAGEPRGCYMGAGTGHHQFMEDITSNSCGLGYQLMHEDKSRSTGKKAEKSPVLTPIEDDLGDSKEEQVAQAIKKALDENFLCDEEMQLQALLFKNLWLEAEAKLCSISYKARFDRMKIKMEKHKMSQGKDVSVDEAAANKILSFKFSPDLNMNFSVAPEAENDLTSNTGQSSTLSKSVHIDGSDDSVMQRFNILNRREEILSSSFMKGEKDSAKVASDAEDSVMARLNILRQQMNNFSSSFMEDEKVPDMVANDTEDSVMERFNILRRQADNLKSSFMEEKKDQDVVANDAENSVMARLNILRQRGDNLNSSFMEKKKDPDMVPDDTEDDSVVARLNVLEHRGDNLSSSFMEAKNDLDVVGTGSAGTANLGLLKGGLSGDERPNVFIEPYFYYHGVNAGEGKFGSCVDDSGYDSMKQFLLSAADDPVVHPNRKTRPGIQQSSGLYDNSSSDWEHVVKDELV